MRDQTPHCYFVEAPTADLVKIGYTGGSVDVRFKQLCSGSPVALELAAWGSGGRDFERALHERFAEEWSHGEWFKASAALLSMIRAVGLGGDLAAHIKPQDFPRGIFAAHVLHGVDSEGVRRLDPNYVPQWVVEAGMA